MMFLSRVLSFVTAVGLVLLATDTRAQSTTSAITGLVRDASGAAVAGVHVTARHTGTGLARTATTDAHGRYVLAALPLGAFEVRAERDGFRPLLRRGVSLSIGESVVLDLRLELGAMDQEVTVTAETPRVRTDSGELSYLVSEKAIQNLPLNGRNYTDLALLQPGVVAYPHRDGGSVVAHGLGTSINGQDPRSNVYLLDGTLQNDFTNAPASSAAGTTLGTETIRSSAWRSTPTGRSSAATRAARSTWSRSRAATTCTGSAYEFHRNDALDARNFFDADDKPEFTPQPVRRHPGRSDQEGRHVLLRGLRGAAREPRPHDLDGGARRRAARIPTARPVPIPAVRPYLDAFPRPTAKRSAAGWPRTRFPLRAAPRPGLLPGAARPEPRHAAISCSCATRSTTPSRCCPPTSRSSRARSRRATTSPPPSTATPLSDATLHTLRARLRRTRIGQNGAGQPGGAALSVRAHARQLVGDIDIGGIPRFGPQTSANVVARPVRSTALEYGLTRTQRPPSPQGRRPRRALRRRPLQSRRSASASTRSRTSRPFCATGRSASSGLTPEADLDRNWRFTLFGALPAGRLPRGAPPDGERGRALRVRDAAEGHERARLDAREPRPTPRPRVGQLYQNPTARNLSPRRGVRVGRRPATARTSLRGGYGLYFNTQQPAEPDRHRHQPAGHAARDHRQSDVPGAAVRARRRATRSARCSGTSRTRACTSGTSTCSASCCRQTVLTLGYAGSRGQHLLRSSDVNVPHAADAGRTARSSIPPTAAAAQPGVQRRSSRRPATATPGTTRCVVELRRHSARGLSFQSSYTFSRNIDTTQASTFFSDATNGTTSAFPEPFGDRLQPRPGRLPRQAQLGGQPHLGPAASRETRACGRGWQVARHRADTAAAPAHALRRRQPLALALVAVHRARPRARPSEPRARAARRRDAVTGDPAAWFDPTAFVLQPAGTLGDLGRGALVGPDLRVARRVAHQEDAVVALGAATAGWSCAWRRSTCFNRANFGIPACRRSPGTADGEAPLASLGRIRNTVTSARQVQLGVRVAF